MSIHIDDKELEALAKKLAKGIKSVKDPSALYRHLVKLIEQCNQKSD